MQQHLLIVTETKNYLLMSIQEKLKNAAYDVSVVPANTDGINNIKERDLSVSGILIYVDEEFLSQQQSVHFLKDWAIADDIPVFAIGEAEKLKIVKSIIPEQLIRREFLRPIHVNSLVETLDTLIKQFSSQVKKKILVVDDSGAMLRNVKSWLEDKYNVFLANSGAMAIKYLTLNRPDLVLLDYEMPIVDGKQVLEMIRAEMEFSDIPVMFLTGKSDKETIVNVKDLKPEGYLLKTMAPVQIIRAVDEFFEKRKGLILNN